MTIDAFWEWFSSVSSDFGQEFENRDLLAELDARINGLGDFAWEVGPGGTQPNALVISPAGDPELLQKSRAIVARAPDVAGWEFHPAKPPKEWQLEFQIQDESGKPYDIDARGWRYVLLSYPDDALEVLVEAPNISALSETYRTWAAEIVIDGLIGEERRLELILEVSVVSALEDVHQSSAKPIVKIISALVQRH